ncbi:signal peptidase I [Planococcus sp. CAU13]|uniref:signal peptidase I n=1 Tax=Planococcus sp. CAU13 TaxID=1541197 RepID=UPI00068ABB67|nr:signal peptidase I [Planococcus sp. CAU13]
MNETAIIKLEETADSKPKSEAAGWIRFILLLIGVYVFFTYVIGLSIIEGDSMNPTLETNGVLLSLDVFNQYEAGDIVIFQNDYGFSVVKRIIGVPGDTVAIENGKLLVNGTALEEGYTTGIPDDMIAVQVEDSTYFMLGDNRTPGESLDSRSAEVGLVSESDLKGEVVLSLFPLKFSLQ